MFNRPSGEDKQSSCSSQLEKYRIPSTTFCVNDPTRVVENFRDIIGYGCDSLVVGSKFNGKDVAVKCFREQKRYDYGIARYLEKIRREVTAMVELQSPRIVELIGFVKVPKKNEPEETELKTMESIIDKPLNDDYLPQQTQIVMKRYVGSLSGYLQDSKNTVTLEQQLTWAMQVSEGVAHIHGKGWLHGDLKCDNVYFDGENVVIADFGFACRASDTNNLLVDDNNKYISPGLYHNFTDGPSISEDIYRLGTVLWEIVTKKTPFHEYSDDDIDLRFDTNTMKPDTVPEDCPEVLKKIIQECWENYNDPLKCPSAKDIATRLRKAVDALHSSTKDLSTGDTELVGEKSRLFKSAPSEVTPHKETDLDLFRNLTSS